MAKPSPLPVSAGPGWGLVDKPRRHPIDTPTALAEGVVLATGGIGMATLTRLHNRHLSWNKEKLMRARKLIARSSLLIWVIACGSLIASGQNRGPSRKVKANIRS